MSLRGDELTLPHFPIPIMSGIHFLLLIISKSSCYASFYSEIIKETLQKKLIKCRKHNSKTFADFVAQ